jgi:protein ImuB
LTRQHNPRAEAALLAALRRWAGRFSPWVAEEPPDALVADLTGCTHLFGGEAAVMAQLQADCADLGLTVRAGLADTVGAAWALARHAGSGAAASDRSGDMIDQEARATRSRAARRRHWERGGASENLSLSTGSSAGTTPAGDLAGRIAARGKTRQALTALPVSALRLDPDAAATLARLGLRQIGDLAGQPRAALARRFGRAVLRRLDQAFGLEPEPITPAAPDRSFALRLTLPDPIGLQDDVTAGLDRLLPRLEEKLAAAGRGARLVRLQALRCDGQCAQIEVGLARPSADPARIRPLLLLKLADIDAGPGIDCLRLEAPVTEPVHARQHKGHLDAAGDTAARLARNTGLDDLIGRLGARVGMESITRLQPADSHIPEKSATVLAAAWSEPARHWPAAPTPRPLLLWAPEPVDAPVNPAPPDRFRWRRRVHVWRDGQGPERIAPEWWLDDPGWRSGVRDYWQVTTEDGARLWLYYAHGGTMSAGWFCQGAFA